MEASKKKLCQQMNGYGISKKKKKSNTKIKNKIAVMVGEEKLYLKYCRISSRRQEGNLSC